MQLIAYGSYGNPFPDPRKLLEMVNASTHMDLKDKQIRYFEMQTKSGCICSELAANELGRLMCLFKAKTQLTRGVFRTNTRIRTFATICIVVVD